MANASIADKTNTFYKTTQTTSSQNAFTVPKDLSEAKAKNASPAEVAILGKNPETAKDAIRAISVLLEPGKNGLQRNSAET